MTSMATHRSHDGERTGRLTHVPPVELPEALRALLASPQEHAHVGPSGGEVITVQVAPDQLRATVRLLTQQRAHFVDLFADAEGDASQRRQRETLTLHLVFAVDRQAFWLHVVAPLDPRAPHFSSLVSELPAADWYERELAAVAGIEPVDHPMLTRLHMPAQRGHDQSRQAGHPEAPEDVLDVVEAGAPEESTARVPLAGIDDDRVVLDPGPEGVVDYPLGPVRSGVVESGHYTLRTVGEEIVDAQLQLGYKHRGVEQRAVGLGTLHLPLVAERISGSSAFAHALATCEALERAAGVAVPPRARYLRTIYAELERLYNHLGYQADLCQATGLVVGQAQFDILKERILRLNAQLTGHRYLFGACVFGGVAYDPTPHLLDLVRALVAHVRRRMRRLGTMLIDSPSHVDRLENTGILPLEEAAAWATVGPIARASGIDRDLRRDHPYAAYSELTFDVPVLTSGDALARARIRLEETTQTLRLVDQALGQLPGGSVRANALGLPHDGTALGWVESPRGEGVHWIRFTSEGLVARYRVRTASFANAQAFPTCIPGRNILTDFPVIEQSLALSYAGADR